MTVDQVYHFVESVTGTQVWIRHIEILIATEFAKQPDPGVVIPGQLDQVSLVGAVHGHDQVEVVEVRRSHLPRLSADLEATPGAGLDRTGIRRMADVPVAGTGGVDRDLVAKPGFRHQIAHHGLGGR